MLIHKQLPASFLQYGSGEPLPAQRILRAGPLQMLYENGFLRYIRLNDVEIIRSIYFALRDQNWGTFTPQLTGEQVTVREDSFDIRYTCGYSQQNQTIFRWAVAIRGESDGTISFSINGEALQPFLKNRAGFCVLHPVREIAGRAVEITEPSGQVTHTVFPALISPHRPFPYMQAMSWEAAPGTRATLHLDGDVFETEDHRNWTDTSYKTFCTPLALPYPVPLQPGDRVRQSIVLSFTGLPAATSPNYEQMVILSEDTRRHYPIPRIGTSQPAWDLPVTEAQQSYLRESGLSHYRVELTLSGHSWPAQFHRAVAEATSLGIPLELVLLFSGQITSEYTLFLQEAQQTPCPVASILLLSTTTSVTSSEVINLVQHSIRSHFPGAKLGGGTNYNFAEFNRTPFPAETLDFVSYTIHPQEHAFDNLSLVENLESQADTVATARALYPGKAIHVSPVTLRKRFNPYAREVAARAVPLPAEAQADPRQATLFAAGWTLGSLAYLAESGVASLTCFQATGPAGLLADENFPQEMAAVTSGKAWGYPVYVVLRLVLEFAGGTITCSSATDRLACSQLVLRKGNQKRWLIANHRQVATTFQLPVSGQAVVLRRFDYTNALEMMQHPDDFLRCSSPQPLSMENGLVTFALLPFGIGVIDVDFPAIGAKKLKPDNGLILRHNDCNKRQYLIEVYNSPNW